MWDTAIEVLGTSAHLTHERPCASCGHGPHRYLPCSDTCTCPGDCMGEPT